MYSTLWLSRDLQQANLEELYILHHVKLVQRVIMGVLQYHYYIISRFVICQKWNPHCTEVKANLARYIF